MRNFYCQERIASLNLVSALFKARDDNSHTYYEDARKITDSIVANKFDGVGFKEFAFEQFLGVLKIVPEGNDDFKAFLTKQNLLEQKAHLELLIMVYYHYYPVPEQSFAVITALSNANFGSSQSQEFFDKNCFEIHDQVCGLCCVLFIEMLNLELILDRLHGGVKSSNTLFDTPDKLLELHNFIWDKFQGLSLNAASAGVVASAASTGASSAAAS